MCLRNKEFPHLYFQLCKTLCKQRLYFGCFNCSCSLVAFDDCVIPLKEGAKAKGASQITPFCIRLIQEHKPEGLYAEWDKSYLIPLVFELTLCRCGNTTGNVQYSLCLIPGKSAQETKKTGSKHLSFALCGVHEQNVLYAEHKAIVCFTQLTSKQRQ